MGDKYKPRQQKLPKRKYDYEDGGSNVARGMILSGTGRKQIFTSRKDKRPNNQKHSWNNDWED